MTARLAALVAVTVACLLAAAGCGGEPANRAAHPASSTTVGIRDGAPLVVCGVTLSTSAGAPVVINIASYRYPAPINGTTGGGVVYVKVSNSCRTGATITLSPSAAFEIVRTVHATDGTDVLVELRPGPKPVATLRATTSTGKLVGTLRLDISAAYR